MVVQTGRPRTPIDAVTAAANTITTDALMVGRGAGAALSRAFAPVIGATTPATPTTQVTAGSNSVSTPQAVNTAQNMSAIDFEELFNRVIAGVEVPNPLNSFFQVAYHWKLFMVNDKDMYTQTKSTTVAELYSAIDNLNTIIIAETGGTTYNIKDVEIHGIVGPQYETRNVNATRFTMTVVEPISVGFLDALKEAAVNSYIQNLSKCPYYLELSFRGYDELGNIVDPLKDSGLEANRWIWQIAILDIDTTVDASGGTYIMQMQVYNDGSLDQDILTVPQNTIVSGGTIGDVMRSMGERMTASWQARYGNDLVSYEFIMHKILNCPQSISNNDPNTYKMKSNNPDQSSSRVFTYTENGQVSGQLSPGTSWTDMVDWVMANNEKTQDLLMDRDGSTGHVDSSNTRTNANGYKQSIIMRIEPDIEIGEYDTVSANYYKKIHIHIWPYYTQAILTGPVQRDNARDADIQGKMAEQLLKLGFLKKHYNYLYTGVNTEIIDFQLKHNFNWNALLPRLEGARAGVDNTETAARATGASTTPPGNKSETEIQLEQQIREKEALINATANDPARIEANKFLQTNGPPQNVIDAQNIIANADRPNPSLTPQQRADQLTVARATFADYQAKRAAAEAIQKQGTDKIVGAHKDIAALQTRLHPPPASGASQTSGLRSPLFAEDFIKPDGTLAKPSLSDFQYQDFCYAISFRQAYLEATKQAGTGFTGQVHRDKSVYGALIDQMYEQYDKQLATVELTIRGDPFWIGSTNLHRQIFLRANNYDDAAKPDFTKNLPNWITGDQCFLLTFRYPIILGDDNVPKFKENDTFNAIYRITESTASFSEGKFTQRIKGIILPLVDVAQAFTNITGTPTAAASASRGGASTPAQSPAAPSQPLPPTRQLTTAQQRANAAAFKAALKRAAAAHGISLTDAQLDGIVANAYRESHVDPTSHGYDTNHKIVGGILQWNGPRYYAFQSYMGVAPPNATIDQQAEYTIHELATTEGRALRQLQATSTTADASQAWIRYYERPKDTSGGQSINLGFINAGLY